MRSRRSRIFPALSVAALCALAYGAATPRTGPATLTGFQHAGGFSAEGWKGWDISGKQAQMASADAREIDITELRVRLFSGKADLTVETTIESPQATVLPREDQARSNGFLLITGASYTVNGSDWAWNGAQHVIRVNRKVVVKFSPVATAGSAAKATPGKPAQPITIESDSLVINQDPAQNGGRNQFVFTGAVSVTDGNCATTCRELEVLAARDVLPEAPKNSAAAPPSLSVGGIERIIARGRVITREGDLEARGEQMELMPGEQRVIVTGQPQVRDFSNDALVRGSRIAWDRVTDVVLVDPLPATADAPPQVRISLPPLAKQQRSATGVTAGERMVITGGALRADFGKNPRHFELERAVRISDPQLTVDAQRLNAEFDPPAQTPGAGPAGLAASPNAEVGHLKHITASGNATSAVVIYQTHRITTTQQAEIFPARGEIVLSGDSRIEDTYGSANTVLGNRITLFTDESRAFVEGAPGRLAEVIMASLPDIGEGVSVQGETRITSNTLTMQRDRDPSFSFEGNVQVKAGDLAVACGNIEILTRSPQGAEVDATTGDPLDGLGKIGDITALVARNQVVVKQGDYEAHAARTEIFPRVNVTENSADAEAKAKPYRFIELYGDPAGVTGPLRPTVILPIGDMSLIPVGANQAAAPNAGAPATITSDEQKLLTSPGGNIYMFSGNVQIVGVNFQASCHEVLVKARPGGSDHAKSAVEKIIAQGDVRIVQINPDTGGKRVATGGLAEISPAEGTLVLSDKPAVVDGDGPPSTSLGSILLTRDAARGQITTTIVGERGKRPTFTRPANSKTFDNPLKPANKPPAGSAR